MTMTPIGVSFSGRTSRLSKGHARGDAATEAGTGRTDSRTAVIGRQVQPRSVQSRISEKGSQPASRCRSYSVRVAIPSARSSP